MAAEPFLQLSHIADYVDYGSTHLYLFYPLE